jgi:hypothetical protein
MGSLLKSKHRSLPYGIRKRLQISNHGKLTISSVEKLCFFFLGLKYPHFYDMLTAVTPPANTPNILEQR